MVLGHCIGTQCSGHEWVGAGWEGAVAFCHPELGSSVSMRHCVVACIAGAKLK